MAEKRKRRCLAEIKESYAVRYFLKGENIENYRQMQNILVMRGEDEAEYWSNFISKFVGNFSSELKERNLVDGESLRKDFETRFGKDLTRLQLQTLRNTVWTEGVEYWSAPKGESKEFRYDLEKCLEALTEWQSRRKVSGKANRD